MRDRSPSVVGGINPAFLARHGIVPLGIEDGKLKVAMRDGDDPAAIAGLRFATSLDIVQVSLSDAPGHRLRPIPSRHADASLADQLADRLGVRCDGEAALDPLMQLLDAGYDPARAGSIVLAMPHPDSRLREVAAGLAAGRPLAVVTSEPGALPWLAEPLQDWTVRGGDAKELLVKVARPGPLVRRRSVAFRLGAECVLLAILLAAIASRWPGVAAPALALASIVLVAGLRGLRRRRDDDFVRAEVLGLVADLAKLPLAPPLAIRCGLARLAMITGQPPVEDPKRADLAAALALPPLALALLERDDLAAAAARAAADRLGAAERRAGHFAWLLRRGTVAVLALLLAAAIAR